MGWLDGILALSLEDRQGIRRAKELLGPRDEIPGEVTHRILDAFLVALKGDTRAAARRLAEIEADISSEGLHFGRFGRAYPFLSGVLRITAAGWLIEAGDAPRARRLLPFYEVVPPGNAYPVGHANEALAASAIRLRWELARATGRESEAAAFWSLLAGRGRQ
jgi:hypothetical protein